MIKDNRNYNADRNNYHRQNNEDLNRPRVNREIRAYKVRLIDQDGVNHGVVDLELALVKSREVSLDLVEVSPNEKPPVCKIMDIGKYLFEQKKKQKENYHKPPEPREIRLSPGIGQGDLEIKAKKAIEFLDEGSKVTLTFKLKGRELKKMDLVQEVVNRFFALVIEKATLERKDGNYILTPKN